jgi:hypothetical protein
MHRSELLLLSYKLKKCRKEYSQSYQLAGWETYLLTTYGITLISNLDGDIADIKIVDAKKHLIFDLKFS